MDRRIRERRRSVNRLRGRRRGSLILVALLLVAAVGIFVWLRSSDVFAVTRITATATQSITEEEVAQATSAALGVSLLKVSTGDIEQALSALPYVCSAEVYRQFPNTLEVRLVEYTPVARLQGGDGEAWLIAADGRVLEKVRPPRGVNLPLIVPTGPVSPAAGECADADIVNALPIVGFLEAVQAAENLPEVQRIAVSATGDLVLSLEGGGELRLGEPSELEEKLTVAAGMVERYLRDGKQIEYVDVTVPERVAVKAK